VGPAGTRSVPLRIQVPAETVTPGSHKIAIEVRALDDAGVVVTENTTFLGLRP
jgi:hypothetical protein